MSIEFSRQPRFLPEIPRGELEIPNPPIINEKPDISWFSILAPPAVMLVITLFIALTMKSVFLLISISMTVMTLIVSLTGATSQIKKYKKKKKEREEKYLQFIKDTRSELAIAREQQTKAMNEMNPEPAECIQRILRTDHKLWEKTPAYHDFLALRIGLGSAPLELKIKYSKQAIILESDPLLMEPQRVALEYEKIPNVPITANLVSSEICGIAGEKEKITELVKLMLLQLVTHHGYDDVKLVILASEEGLEQWNWLKYVPHLWDDEQRIRFMLCGSAIAHQTLTLLNDVFKERELKSEGAVGMLPHYVFVVEDTSLLENEQISKYLYNGSAKLGISTIFLAASASYLPMNCKTVITLQGKSGEIIDRLSGEKIAFTPDQLEYKDLEMAARKLTPLRIKSSAANFSLPASISLLETLQVEKVTEVDVLIRWNKNKTYRGMSVPIGAKAGGSLFNLDMHETGHGPHGLVAGTTGSGKSELLQSIIISQAIHYHPHDIVFVLIDYKGGGMADVFKGMPHLVGTITNLGGNQTTRALLSIKSELMRRQRLFSEYGVNNIDRYQKLYYSRKDSEMPAIPHLVMIADEFAELKQDQPDFMKELVSAARVGRSLGVHLILATQKPAGVVDDQIWSNSKFKLCLKVQDEADSKDVIKRPDAAMIKEPGRAYIQVGNDEIFELFQSTYSGADYDPEGELQKSENKTKRLYRLALNGISEQIYPLEEEKMAKNEVPSQLSAMVQHITRSAQQFGIEPLKGPWLPPLAETLYLEEVSESGFRQGEWLKREQLLSVPIGVLDDPRGQRQEPLEIDFATEGNLFVYGTPGTGKTVLLKTLCLSMAQLYSPVDVNMYIMDFGGSSLKSFEKLPHVGGVMTLEQESIIQQFMLYLFRMIEERKSAFEEAGLDGFVEYRKSGGKMPAVVVLIDNYFALSETYEEVDTQMIVLAREGTKYGIYVVATATNASLVRYKFSVNFKMAITYQMTDKSDYDGIVGRTEGLEPAKVAGRGLIRGTPPLEFQTALPEYQEQMTDDVINMLTATSMRAAPIPVMPAMIDIRELNTDTDDLAIGLANHNLQPLSINLVSQPVQMIAGDPLSGKSTLLVSWITMLAEKLRDLEVYALDSSSMGIYQMMDLPQVTDLAQVEDMGELVEYIKEKIETRRNQLISYRMAGRDVNEVLEQWNQIVFVFDRLSEFTGNDMYTLHELLERIVKQERGLKIAVLAADDTADLAANWDSLGKVIREEQTGILLGSLREQNLFSASLPYGVQEKHLEQGDGYFLVKNRYTGLRCAVLQEKAMRKVTV